MKSFDEIEQIDINALRFAIMCNFPDHCGNKRTQEALELFNELVKNLNTLKTENEQQQKEIEQLKAKQPRWIAVSERLPKVDKYGDVNVLVCMDDEFIATATYDKNNGWELWAESGEVIAWQPLPEPYKGEEE